MPGIMIQGTGSNVGKSLLVAGLCRAFVNRGLTVRPFKPQNMSNNAAVTDNGGEIGRAQALQAKACRTAAHTDMNPVLLKPQSESGSQIIVHGKLWDTAAAKDYATIKQALMQPVQDSYQRLSGLADLVIIEGAGSPAEINLRRHDIANMGFAQQAKTPVILAGDIDRGGVIAQLVGTKTVLPDDDAALIKGFMVNKFRGDPVLFDDGYQEIIKRTGWSGLGVLPWFADAWKFPAEDSLDLQARRRQGRIKIACFALPRIANFDDLDPLSSMPDIDLIMIRPGMVLPGDCDLVILPGSKSTIADLAFLRAQGWHIDLAAHHRRGGHILGICGGYQMLGRRIADPHGVEGLPGTLDGLGLLDIETIMHQEKQVTTCSAIHAESGLSIQGYEIHIGHSEGPDCDRPFAHIDGRADGATSIDGQVIGSYLHGLFSENQFRQWFLSRFQTGLASIDYDNMVDSALGELASHMEQHMDLDQLWRIAQQGI